MTTLEQAARLALKALEDVVKAHGYVGGTPVEAVNILREALEAAPELARQPLTDEKIDYIARHECYLEFENRAPQSVRYLDAF